MYANKFISSTGIYTVSMNMAYKSYNNRFKIIVMLFDKICCVAWKNCFQGCKNSMVMFWLALLLLIILKDKFFQINQCIENHTWSRRCYMGYNHGCIHTDMNYITTQNPVNMYIFLKFYRCEAWNRILLR